MTIVGVTIGHPTGLRGALAGAAAFCRGPLAMGGRALHLVRRDSISRDRVRTEVLLMFKRIILAVDLAEPAQVPKGLPEALELANAGGGNLRLVNVQPVVPATFMEYVPADFDVEQNKRAKETLDAVLDSVDLPAERKSAAARAGGIYHELLQEAADWNADLIVVGSHRPLMTDYLLGSNAKTIVRHAQCSVLVVRE